MGFIRRVLGGHATVLQGAPEPGTFPWPADYRDPNKAWSTGGKLAFLFIFVTFCAALVAVVHFWPLITRLVKRFRRAAAGASGAQAGAGAVGPASAEGTGAANGRAAPLLELENREVCEGATPAYPKDRRVVELFSDRVKETPGAIALSLPEAGRLSTQDLTYSMLDAAVEECAMALLSMGVSCGSVAALVLDRSVAQVVAVFGTLRTGAAFLPVDVDASEARKQFLVRESEALVLIGSHVTSGSIDSQDAGVVAYLADEMDVGYVSLPRDGSLKALVAKPPRPSGSFPPRRPSLPVERARPDASDMALLIYTSGTTGAPKGIVYDHTHLMHGVHFFGEHCEMDDKSVALLKSPYFWAIIEWEMFPALTRGGRLVVASAQGHKNPEYLADTISKQAVTVLMITPQVLDLVVDIHEANRSARPLQSLQHIVTVGEPLASALANRVVTMDYIKAQLHNFYGASESSCTTYTIPSEGVDMTLFPNKVPAGVPQPHSKVYIMAVQEEGAAPGPLTRVQPGQAGEICFGGVLAACYWRHEDLTQQKWLDTEYGRLYRTGDLGRWRAGVLEVVGRTDRQVKIRGVRVEPEEIEAVLKKFAMIVPQQQEEQEPGILGLSRQGSFTRTRSHSDTVFTPETRFALKDVAVVASREPAELVAFVTMRRDFAEATTESLRAHCQANLSPSYVPKHFVILSEMPKLPNGKNNLSELREMASQEVTQEELVMDSLGQMKRLSKWAIFENNVIHRCYAFWMIGVLTDHYMHCAADTTDSGDYYAFCTALASSSVKPWTEVLIRAFGNDQDMFGFMMLGAYQDSRPDRPGGKPRVKLGLRDLFIFIVYMAMACPLPQILHYIFQSWAWPHTWGENFDGTIRAPPKDIWGWDYMQVNSYTSDHRWYLDMVLRVRIYMQICETLRVPGWLQGMVATIPCLLPDATFEGHEYAFDVCEFYSAYSYVLYVFSWLFRNWGDGCAAYWRWIQWYFAFYVWAFHYLRPLVDRLHPRLPKGPTWAAAAMGTSMTIGIMMAMFHYPNNVLENGTGLQWAWLELGADILQPTLLVLGMTYLPLNLAWWGNTTLGCYVFHFYFRDQITTWVMSATKGFTWDPTGLFLFVFIIGICLLITTVLGPIGHYVLLSPQMLVSRVKRFSLERSRARQARDVPPTVVTAVASMQSPTAAPQ